MDFLDKVKEKTNQVLKSIELSIEELVVLAPNKMEDAINDFEEEIKRLKDRLISLDQEKEEVKKEIEERKKTRKELVKRLKKKI